MKGSYTPLADTLKQVDSITKDDIVKVCYGYFYVPLQTRIIQWCRLTVICLPLQVSRSVFGSRATLVAHGNLSSTPRLDHLLADISLK